MKLIDKMIQSGDFLFKYRGQIPLLIFIIGVPIIYTSSYYLYLSEKAILIIRLSSFLISFLGLLLRYITIARTPKGTSGKNRDIQIADKLNTKGIYSTVRNPLYLANYIIWLGISIYSLSLLFVFFTSFFFILHYQRIILLEEDFLHKKYGLKYESYISKTPIFIPNFKNYIKSNYDFSIKAILRQEYSSTFSTFFSFLYIDVVCLWIFNHNNSISSLKTHIILLIIAIIITLLIKIVKSYTMLLRD